MMRNALVVLAMVVAACYGRLEESATTDEVALDAGSGSDWIQPTCVDERRTDHPGTDDGQRCSGDPGGEVVCTMTSACPNYCVTCAGVSRCYPCP